jgi:hypothetical protein
MEHDVSITYKIRINSNVTIEKLNEACDHIRKVAREDLADVWSEDESPRIHVSMTDLVDQT